MESGFLVGADMMKNISWKLEETVPDYFNSIVLQRHNVEMPESSFGHVKFQVAFNLAVVWMIVFVSLSKGMLRLEITFYLGMMLCRIYP
jgi:solute carrier family 6 (neurotransmitter transporter)